MGSSSREKEYNCQEMRSKGYGWTRSETCSMDSKITCPEASTPDRPLDLFASSGMPSWDPEKIHRTL
jgi:hypothetical protein